MESPETNISPGLTKELTASTLEDGIQQLNAILFSAHQAELALRQTIASQQGFQAIESHRPFEISADPNSDPLCQCFRDTTLTINQPQKQVFLAKEGPIKIGNNTLPYHVYFCCGNNIIDPTFGQIIQKLGQKPEGFRKTHPDLFINSVFTGTTTQAATFGINYHP